MSDTERIDALERATESLGRVQETLYKICYELANRVKTLEARNGDAKD